MICLRYDFESLEAFARHLRLGNGLFVPLRPPRGNRAALEISWPDRADPMLLHGRVRERNREGAWIDLPPTWILGPLGSSRRDRRVPCDLFAEVKPQEGSPYLCRALDVSPRGARLATGAFEVGVKGDEVALTLLAPGAPEIPARVAWSGAREAGLELLETPAGLVDLIAAADAQWEKLEHSSSCRCSRAALRVG
jgi:hypothetical protein